MTRRPISHRMLAAALALIVATPLLTSKIVSAAGPPNPVSETKGDCLSNLNGSRFGVLRVATPTLGQPDVVRVSYAFGPSIGRTITSDFRFFYSTPEGAFAIPRAAIASLETIQGSFDVPAITGKHHIRIVVAYISPPYPQDPNLDFRLTCETTFDVVSLTTTTKPTSTTTAPATVPVASTTIGVTTTVTPTAAPATTATTTPAATAPPTTMASTTSTAPLPIAPQSTVATAPKAAAQKAKAKQTVKKRKTTKKTKRPATTVKR